MAGSSQDLSSQRARRRLQVVCFVLLAWAGICSAAPTGVKQGLVDKVVYVSDDPAVKKWRQELSGVGIYPAHYALKALDLLPLPHTPVRFLTVRRRHVKNGDHRQRLGPRTAGYSNYSASMEPRALEGRRRKKNKGGHDENGYDDGSWRGDKGDYGSEKDMGGEAENAEYESWQVGTGRGDRHSYGDSEDYGNRGDNSATEEDDASPDYSSEAQDSAFHPYTEKAKYKSAPSQDPEEPYLSSGSSWRRPGTAAPSEDESRHSDPATDSPPHEASNVNEGDEGSNLDADDDVANDRYAPSAEQTTSDCASLRKLFDDMGGHEWIDSTGWTADASSFKTCCRAFGVSCNTAGRVTALDLGSNGLSGPLSPAVFDLRYLTRLNVSANAISAELPDKFDSLPRLGTLYLEQNTLRGSIPASLHQSAALSSIHISNNVLEGPLSFPNARNLTQLYAARNRFTGLDISSNSALIKVALDDNQFNCTLPDIEAFVDLQVFSVARNHFTGSPPAASDLQKLVKLDLQANQLSGPFPDVAGLPRLQYLGLNGNSDLSGPFPIGKAPPNLVTCHVDTVLASSCPAQNVLDDPESLAAKCSISCRGGGKPSNAALDPSVVDGSTSPVKQSPEGVDPVKQKPKSLDSIGQTPASLAQSLSGGDDRTLAWPSTLIIAGIVSLFFLV